MVLKTLSNNQKLNFLLEYFQQAHPRKIDLDLKRTLLLLEKLEDPHHYLPPTIHVAGTNGKGSTISFLRYIYESAGYKVHTYTSPHLVYFNERIRLAGELISDELLAKYLAQIKEVNQGNPITLFEATTAAAFLAFRNIPADVVLLETGLGGRLDATNVLKKPIASVITPISIDHQEFLGDTLFKIAAEKAGIIKEKSPTFIAPQLAEVEELLNNNVKSKDGSAYLYGKEWGVSVSNKGFTLMVNDQSFELPFPYLKGSHQIINAGLACTTAINLQTILPILPESLSEGIKRANWPGRLQKLEVKGGEVWMDGAHNDHGFECLRQFITEERANDSIKGLTELTPVIIMVAMLKNRDPALFFNRLSNVADKFILLDMQEDRFHSPENLFTFCKNKAIVMPFPDNIIPFLEKKANGSRIFIAGSLYLVGRVLESIAK